MARPVNEKLQWQTELGQIMDGDRRYLMMRPDVLMGALRLIPTPLQGQAFEALRMSVRDHGGQSAKAYFSSVDNDPDRLLQTMIAYSAELGWGVWDTRRASGALYVNVRNSPFAHGFGSHDSPVCHPIVGMLETVGELVLGAEVTVHETQCAAQGHSHCAFAVSRNS